jgi:hypothetical protein
MLGNRALMRWQPTIHRVTENLARLAAGQGDDGVAESWSNAEWRIALVACSIHGLFPILHQAAVPAFRRWQSFLAEQYELTRRRNHRLLTLCEALLMEADRRGARVMPLKGMDMLVRFYDDSALRSTSDIDLLVPPGELAGFTRVALDLGWAPVEETERHTRFVIPPNRIVTMWGEHPANPITLELHTAIGERLAGDVVNATDEVWREAEKGAWRATKAALAAPSALMLHLLLHASAHMFRRTLRWIALHDIHLLSQHMTKADWRALSDALERLKGLWWVHPPMALCERYFPGTFPIGLSERARRACPQRLLWCANKPLAAFSHCNLRAGDLPHGLSWARGLPQAANYLMSVSFPVRSARLYARRSGGSISSICARSRFYLSRVLASLWPCGLRVGAWEMFGFLADASPVVSRRSTRRTTATHSDA